MCVILSIIIPTYNCKKYIDECLISVLNKLPQNAEVIIVDDGSQDGTGELLSAYEHRHDIIKALYSRHGGASHARNLGLDKAQGEFVMFLDCDDCLREGFWEESLPLLSTNADLFIFGIERIEMSGDHSSEEIRMIIKKSRNVEEMIIRLSGKLDASTVPMLQKFLGDSIDTDNKKLVFDLADVDAVSPEGLHFLISVNDRMVNKKGMILRNVRKETMELFDTAGLSKALTIERGEPT